MFVCFIIFHFCLACLALQTENIVQKITQPIFVFGNFVNKNKKRKMGWKAQYLVKKESVCYSSCFEWSSLMWQNLCHIIINHLKVLFCSKFCGHYYVFFYFFIFISILILSFVFIFVFLIYFALFCLLFSTRANCENQQPPCPQFPLALIKTQVKRLEWPYTKVKRSWLWQQLRPLKAQYLYPKKMYV